MIPPAKYAARALSLLLVVIATSLSFLIGGQSAQAETIFKAPLTGSDATQIAEKIGSSREWIKLLHYQKTFFGFTSEIDGATFFAAKQGRHQPVSEVLADVAAFTASQTSPRPPASDAAALDQQLECRWPARFAFLKANWLGAERWQMPTCPRWDRFREGINGVSATLVFSSYYLNNPSSAFGHTFIRLNRDAGGGEHHPLLDYGIGFAANAGQSNPVMYALGGLFGWFSGDFTNVPYYLKVQEYNDFEARDLWEYDLNLNPSEIKLLVEHIWEVSNSHMSYFYLNTNCSSVLFTTLEAAAPRLELSHLLPYWVIPSDTVKALFQVPNFVTTYHFRPSKRSQFLARYRELTPENQDRLRLLTKVKSDVELNGILDQTTAEIPRQQGAALVDALIDYFDFRYFREINTRESAQAKMKQTALIARSRFPAQPTLAEFPEPTGEAPQLGHPSARARIGVLNSRLGENALLVGQRFALHDFEDPQAGYPSDAELNFLDLNFRVLTKPSSYEDNQGSVKVEEVYAFAVKSYAPYERLIPNKSWKFRMGAERTWDEACNACTVPVFGGGGGLSTDFMSHHRVIGTLLLQSDLSASSEYARNGLKLRLGPELNLRWLVSENLIFQVNAIYDHLFFTDVQDAYRIAEDLRWSQSGWSSAVGVGLKHLPRGDTEMSLEAFYYY